LREESLLEILRLLAHADGVAESISTNKPNSLRDLVFGIVVDHRGDSVEFLDASGNLILTMRHKEGGLVEEYDFSSGGDCHCLEWNFVKRVLNLESDTYGDKFSGIAHSGSGNYFYVAGPIRDEEGNFVGVVLVGTSLEHFVKNIREDTLTQVTFYNSSGLVLARFC